MICRLLLLTLSLLLLSCENNISINKKNVNKINKEPIFINKGFTLIYDDDLFLKKIIDKKIDEKELTIFQKNLKKDTKVLITNIKNKKVVIAKVGNKSKYPYFYNSVITPRISQMLDLDVEEPYIEIKKINPTNLFVANIAKTYDEEKNVASKAPVEKIKIKDLSPNNANINVKKNNKFNYAIFIADFYFKDSSNLMATRIKENTTLQNIMINKINNTQYRVTIGPFIDLSSLKNAFNELKILNFENIEIIQN